MRQRLRTLLPLFVLTALLASPALAEADDIEEPDVAGTECPNDKWTKMTILETDESVRARAERRDARGNADGLVCQRSTPNGKFAVKDNNKPASIEPDPPEVTDDEVGTECPNDKWTKMTIEETHESVTEKAAKRDARGNADGLVCQRMTPNGKYHVKDNNSLPGVAED